MSTYNYESEWEYIAPNTIDHGRSGLIPSISDMQNAIDYEIDKQYLSPYDTGDPSEQ